MGLLKYLYNLSIKEEKDFLYLTEVRKHFKNDEFCCIKMKNNPHGKKY